ncbi:hypothetical protein K456DRAFT_210294 [Colletotrichum gloeosporioides 23]|nr:hypothetical protein K456DRAFT_210294 [Colletotrichum gloeosporioides 23]
MMKVPSLPSSHMLPFPSAGQPPPHRRISSPLPPPPPPPFHVHQQPPLPSLSSDRFLSQFLSGVSSPLLSCLFPWCSSPLIISSRLTPQQVRHSWSYHPQQRPVQQAHSTQHSPAQRTQSTLELLNLGISLIIRPSPCLSIRLSVCLSLSLVLSRWVDVLFSCHCSSRPHVHIFSKRLSAAFHLQVRVNSKVV